MGVSAVLLVMIIGMSIDYAVHIAHAYNEGVGSRAQKTLQVIQGVGVSVLSGALTTFLASLPIFGTLIYVYFKMAIFLVRVALFGVFYSFAMLIPSLYIFGPEGDQGNVCAYFCKPGCT